MNVKFYRISGIDPSHRVVIANIYEYLNALAYTQREIADFVPDFTDQFTFQTAPFSGVVPNYITTTFNGLDIGCFISCRFDNPLSVTVTATPDWWYNFTATQLQKIYATGKVDVSTLYKSGHYLAVNDLANDTFHITPPRIKKNSLVPHAFFSHFRLSAVITYCDTRDDAFAGLTGNPRIEHTATYISNYVGTAELTMAHVEELTTATQFCTGTPTNRKTHYLTSINKIQIIPANFDFTGSTSAKLCFFSDGSDDFLEGGYLYPQWWDDYGQLLIELTIPPCSDSKCMAIGNYSIQIPLYDTPNEQKVYLYAAFGGLGIKFYIPVDGNIIDVSEAFTIPVAYSNAKSLADQTRIANAVALSSSVVSLAGTIGATVATGGAAAGILIPAVMGAAQTGASIINNRPVANSHITSSVGWCRNLIHFGMFGYLEFSVINYYERVRDSQWYGFSGSQTVNKSIATLIEGVARGSFQYEYLKMRDVIVRTRGDLQNVLSDDFVVEFETALSNGIWFCYGNPYATDPQTFPALP